MRASSCVERYLTGASIEIRGRLGRRREFMAESLYWDSTYEIVLALMETYPDAELESLSLDDLNRRIIQLPNFADDPDLVNDAILKGILRDWYEEIGA